VPSPGAGTAWRRRAALLAVPLLLAACAMSERDNRRTLNALDAALAPGSAGARWALAPVGLPAGLVALAADAVLVHPACVVDVAWGDTRAWLWTPDPDESRFRRAVLLPLVTLATPPVLVGDWLGRVFFAVPARAAEDGP